MQRLHSAIPYAGRRLPFLARHALALSHPLSTAATGGGGSSSSADIGNAASLPDTLARLSLSTEVVPPGVPEATVASRVHFLEALGVPDIPAAVRADPQLLSRDLLTEARPRLEYLLSLGVDGIGPMVGKCPQLLTCDVTHDLLRRVNILRALGVVNISRWLQANPYILMMDVETDMRPAVEFLRTIESVDVGKVLERAPLGIFGRVDHLRERVRFFEETLGLSPRWRVGRMISRYPPVLGFSTTAIEAKVCTPTGAAMPPHTRTDPDAPRPPHPTRAPSIELVAPLRAAPRPPRLRALCPAEHKPRVRKARAAPRGEHWQQ
jgi:hypothetical protein